MFLNKSKVRIAALNAGCTQTEIATYTGLSRPCVNRAFNGYGIAPKTAKVIANALNVDLASIIDRLAAYEDSGLTTEESQRHKGENMTVILKVLSTAYKWSYEHALQEGDAELIAYEEGRLAVIRDIEANLSEA